MKFLKLTELLVRYFVIYERQYGHEALISYLEGYISGLRRQK